MDPYLSFLQEDQVWYEDGIGVANEADEELEEVDQFDLSDEAETSQELRTSSTTNRQPTSQLQPSNSRSHTLTSSTPTPNRVAGQKSSREAPTLQQPEGPPSIPSHTPVASTSSNKPRSITPISNAAMVNVSNILSTSKLQFAREASTLLDFSKYKIPAKIERIPSSLSQAEVNNLLQWGMISRITDQNLIQNYMLAFVVPKADNGGRFICHPKVLNNQKHRDDPSADGLSMAQLLKSISKYMNGEIAIHVLETDFKNFFPQLIIPKIHRRFFGILVDGISYWLNSVCQGWCRSTTLAQALSWIIITYGSKGIINFANNECGRRIPSLLIYRIEKTIIILAIV